MTTIEEFLKKRNIKFYRNKKIFPYSQNWQYPTSMDNMIKQWHSIEHVWNYMDSQGNYTHVGLFRTDQLYNTPITILDENNLYGEYAVRGNFGAANAKDEMLNDRLFYGTYNFAKVWATYRFSFVDEYLKMNRSHVRNRGLHSETFLYYLMKKYVPSLQVNGGICAWRIRNDCRVRKECSVTPSANITYKYKIGD